MIGRTFFCTTCQFMLFVLCMHASYAHQDIKWNTFSQIFFLGISMGDRLEAQVNTIENIQEEFGHDIWEVKEQLIRLTNLLENHMKIEAVHPRGLSPLPNQQIPRPFVQTTSHLLRGINRPNLRQSMPTAPSVFMATYQPADQSSGSRGKHCGQKINKDKPRWDPIPITYTELFPKLVEIGQDRKSVV